MAKVALAQLIANKVGSALAEDGLSKQLVKKFVDLLFGVPLRYSCPFPLLVDEDSSRRHDFQTLMLASLSSQYLSFCREAVRWPNVAQIDQAQLFEALFVRNPNYTKLIVYPSYASGDMYGVGASMLLDPTIRLRLVSDDKQDRIDRTNALRGFLTSFLDPSRISAVKASVEARAYVPPFDSATPITQLRPAEQGYIEWLSTDLWSAMYDAYRKDRATLVALDLFFGTNYIASRFSIPQDRPAARQTVRAGWGADHRKWSVPTVKKLGAFLKGKGFVEGGKFPRNRDVVVLWVRFTGKTGGAHVEYDSSFEGLRQLLRVAYDKGNHWAIIVGDKPKLSAAFSLEKANRRLQKITKIIRESPLPTVDLTEFWSDRGWQQDFPKRTDQFKLFELLHHHNRVKHLGARSGNLESLALLGYQVRYFEDRYDDSDDALDKKRMEPWHDSVGYKRLQISEVPTRSGKYVLAQRDNYPRWTYNSRISFKPTVNKPTPNKRERQKLKSPEISNGLKIVHELGRETWPPPPDLARTVKIFDINRSRPDYQAPLEVLPFFRPRYEKGFTSQDLVILGSYLKPNSL